MFRYFKKTDHSRWHCWDEYDLDPLKILISRGNIIVVRYICSKSKSCDFPDASGYYPLDYAAKYHPEMVQMLLKYGYNKRKGSLPP